MVTERIRSSVIRAKFICFDSLRIIPFIRQAPTSAGNT